jgi:hypothetical protein
MDSSAWAVDYSVLTSLDSNDTLCYSTVPNASRNCLSYKSTSDYITSECVSYCLSFEMNFGSLGLVRLSKGSYIRALCAKWWRIHKDSKQRHHYHLNTSSLQNHSPLLVQILQDHCTLRWGVICTKHSLHMRHHSSGALWTLYWHEYG